MSRKNFIAVLAIFLFQASTPFSSATVGPSLKPTRLGQTIIWRGKKYTAIKSGKKIIWNKGVALPSPKPSSSPTPSAKPSPSPTPSSSETPTPTPTQTPTPTPEPTSSGTFDIDLGASSEVPNGETRIFNPADARLQGKGFIITREKNALVAFDTNCTHELCPVEMGTPNLVCNCHMSYFNRITGNVEDGPASQPLRSYPVKETNGRIIVTNSR